jgi:hypothetical protein
LGISGGAPGRTHAQNPMSKVFLLLFLQKKKTFLALLFSLGAG